MPDDFMTKPWEDLEDFIEKEDRELITNFLFNMTPHETAWTISHLNERNHQKLFTLLTPEDASELLKDLPDEQAADLIENLPADQASAIVENLPVDEQVDLIGDMEDEEAQALLEEMTPEDAQKMREVLQYPEDSAGGIMDTDFLAYPASMTVGEVFEDISQNSSEYSDYDVQYIYVTDEKRRLLGVLKMRQLLFSPRSTTIHTITSGSVSKFEVSTSLDELIDFFEENEFVGIPVVKKDALVGVVRRHHVLEASGDRDRDAYLKVSGIVGGEELRSMPLLERSGRRLSWLSVNIVLNVLAASVIAMYQETLSAVIALAVFLPIISDMSGCSGNQAVAVSIRELTLGVIRPFELMRVLGKEIGVGIINGVILGLLLGGVAFLWKGNFYFGLVVGGALTVNTIVAVCLGGMIPLFLQKSGKDPALASGPLLTTVTDMCGFFFALSFATWMLPHL